MFSPSTSAFVRKSPDAPASRRICFPWYSIKIDNPHSQPRFSAGMLSLSTVAFINENPFVKYWLIVECAKNALYLNKEGFPTLCSNKEHFIFFIKHKCELPAGKRFCITSRLYKFLLQSLSYRSFSSLDFSYQRYLGNRNAGQPKLSDAFFMIASFMLAVSLDALPSIIKCW